METSEEKTLPATTKKLEDARKKGRISKSADAVAAANLFVVVVFLFVGGAMLFGRVADLIDVSLQEAALTAANDVSIATFAAQLSRLSGALLVTLALALIPLAAAATASSLVSNVVLNRGMLFTFEPMKPSLEALNPVKGLQRIFGKRGLVEFAKAVVKLLLMGTVLTTVMLLSLNSLVHLPECGFGCLADALTTPLLVILSVALLLFIVAGAIDVIIQHKLFLDEMKMTKTEAKQERKDQEGDPTIKSARRRLAREAANEQFPIGVRAASVFVYGPDATVGIRYVTQESRVPILVVRAKAPAHMRVLAAARDTGAPIVSDPRLARELAAKCQPGKPVPNELFGDVARLLWASGVVSS